MVDQNRGPSHVITAHPIIGRALGQSKRKLDRTGKSRKSAFWLRRLGRLDGDWWSAFVTLNSAS
jgi:hypothetical protein